MNYKKNKIKDFCKKLKDNNEYTNIIVGPNGSGKTRYITKLYKENRLENIYIPDSYPILLKLIMSFLQEQDILEENKYIMIESKHLNHINKLVGKEYTSLEYTAISLSELEDIVSEGEMEIIFGKYLADYNLMENKNLFFFDINVKLREETINSLYLGVGELSLISYYIFLKDINNHNIYIDEPCNYLSYSSISNFSKLLISNSFINKNKFTLTTNNMDFIDILCYYNCNFKLQRMHLHEPHEIDIKDYYNKEPDRYEMLKLHYKPEHIIFVEDNLAKKYVSKDFLSKYIFQVEGEGNLQKIQKVIRFFEDVFIGSKFTVIYDGDQLNNESICKSVRYLPFDNVESYVVERILTENWFTDISSSDFSRAIEICNSNEMHDAYNKVCKLLNICDDDIIEFLYNEFGNDYLN